MGILIVVLVVAVLALGWWVMSGSSSGSHMTDEQRRWAGPEHERDKTRAKRPIPAWALGLVIAAILFAIGIIVLQALELGDNPVLGDAVATLRPLSPAIGPSGA